MPGCRVKARLHIGFILVLRVYEGFYYEIMN